MRSRYLALILALAAAASAQEAPPARAQRPLVLLANLGWNTLAGCGFEVSYRLRAQLYADAGAGYVVSGYKAGARLRWNFSDEDGWAPFASAGVVQSLGQRDDQTIDDSPPFTFHVGAQTAAQLLVGLDSQDGDRLVFRWELGWSQALNHRDLRLLSGHPSDASWSEVKLLAAGGLVVGFSAGYAF